MGNVLETGGPQSDATDEEDLVYLCVQNSSIFNDGYLSEVYESLPEFDGTDLPEV